MNTQKYSGFTIIEVMLFLAITGALAVGVLAGAGYAIDQQRYRDSVNSFKGLVQDQYGQITNVINENTKNPHCTPSSGNPELTFNEDQSALEHRGTSDCLVLGRFLFIDETRVTTYNVIGEPDLTAATRTNDTAMLRDFAIALRSPQEQEVSWGARLVIPKTNTPATVSMLIVRSPLSGTILTYIQNGDHRSNLRSMLSDGNMAQKDFCVDPGGMTVSRNRLAVRIAAGATNQSAVEIPLEVDSRGVPVCD